MCVRRARLCVLIALTNILFIDESILYEISHGFDIIHDLNVMAWIFKDILRLFFYRFLIGNTQCVLHIAYTNSTLLIIWPGLNLYSPMDNLNILLLSLMVGSDAFNLIAIGGFHLHDWS